MEILSSLKGGYQTWLSSVSEINGLAIDQLEKITEKQINSTKYFTGLGIQHLKKLQGVNNLDGLKTLASESLTLTGNITEKILEDGQEGFTLSNAYNEKLIEIVSSNVNKKTSKKTTTSK